MNKRRDKLFAILIVGFFLGVGLSLIYLFFNLTPPATFYSPLEKIEELPPLPERDGYEHKKYEEWPGKG